MQHSELVYVKRVKGKGRGVFARVFIPEDTLIEKVPVLLFPIRHISGGLKNPSLARFCFIRSDTTVAIALGYGSLYNHSYTPNAWYEQNGDASMAFLALRDIEPDEEITINYNGDPDDGSPMSFEVV